jgi:hypothetical protein
MNAKFAVFFSLSFREDIPALSFKFMILNVFDCFVFLARQSNTPKHRNKNGVFTEFFVRSAVGGVAAIEPPPWTRERAEGRSERSGSERDTAGKKYTVAFGVP